MRFLADETCDFSVVRALRPAAHDVTRLPKFRHEKKTMMLEKWLLKTSES